MALYHEDIAVIDLETGSICRSFLSHTIGEGDISANRFGVRVQRNGEDEDISGSTCTGYFIRSTGDTVVISGSISENIAYVTLPETCYAQEGQFSLAIKLTGGGVTGTMRIVDGVVSNTTTNTIVDPGTIIPDIEDLIEAINTAVASIPADYSALIDSLELAGKENGVIIPFSMYTIEGILNSAGTDVTTVGDYYTTEYIPIFDQDIFFFGGFFPVDTYNTFVLYDSQFNVLVRAKGERYVKVWEYPTAKYFRASADVTESPDNPTYYTMVGNRKSYEYSMELAAFFSSPTPEKLPVSLYKLRGLMSGDGRTINTSFADDYRTTDYIEIIGEHMYFSGGFFPLAAYTTFCLYDESYTPLVTGIGNQVIALDDYPTAKYFRASMGIEGTYIVSGSKMNPNELPGKVIHVGAGLAYSTLRAGIAEAVKTSGSVVYVHPGTYDLTSEFAAEISAASGGTTGLELSNNVTVIFMSGAYVKALFPQTNNWINTYFSPIFGKDFILDGLNIEASNCRYCVHDEQSGANVFYHNVYKNCVMKMTANSNLATHYNQCIGGGLGKYGYIEIIGGRYTSIDSNSSSCDAVSYHNGAVTGADSKFFIRDVYLGDANYFRFGYFGPSTVKSPVYVSGCSMGGSIVLAPETAGSTEENFSLTEWNNQIRN